jgi:CheY-like chemotaxis protein
MMFLDINLPKKNGHEVLQYVKESEELRHIPVIMLTTSSSEKDIVESYRHYANCYITKPVDVNHFIDVISHIENYWFNVVQLPHKKNENG